MPSVKKIEVKEDVAELRKLYRKAAYHQKPRIKMLLLALEEGVHSKGKLAAKLKANPNSVQAWKRAYEKGGLQQLLCDRRRGNNPSVVDETTHKALAARLTNAADAPRSYCELQDWVKEHYLPGIHYHTLRSYVRRHFGAKIKVARKTHIQKDPEAAENFKKKSRKK